MGRQQQDAIHQGDTHIISYLRGYYYALQSPLQLYYGSWPQCRLRASDSERKLAQRSVGTGHMPTHRGTATTESWLRRPPLTDLPTMASTPNASVTPASPSQTPGTPTRASSSAPVAPSSSSKKPKAKPANLFSNDGSFLERFQKLKQVQTIMELATFDPCAQLRL